MKCLSILISLTFLFLLKSYSQNYIIDKNEAGSFPIVSSQATAIYTDANDDWLVQKSAVLFQEDVERVTGKKPGIIHTIPAAAKDIIVIGSLAQSSFIKQLVQTKKINAGNLQDVWEAYSIQVIKHPFKGIDNVLVIAGTDKRGTAFGVFELSKQMGVSPWYWWADVPVKKKKEVYLEKNILLRDHPRVKYRGIFINDEAPAFSGWAKEKFGGINHHVYEKVFELLLRLKANYLWPAMWGNAFNDDDSLNPVLADKYGIVMGTSHHEPMLRAQQEWKRYGKGEWNYQNNSAELQDFWRKGIENMGSHESIVTIGMRGDGDKPMTEGTATALLEKIVGDQRKIIEEVTHKPASHTPQLWALYKEVQDYYDKGMRVPDDVTLLLCDDNWGNIRKLPKFGGKHRNGGYGIYYHFDYVGDPRNYKWINTNNIARVWEQMNLAYEYGVDKIWIVNVGDLKPMEFPVSFFLDDAWNPKKWNADNLQLYYTQWTSQQFGAQYSKEIADIIRKYSQYNARIKPELLSPGTYSLLNYGEADTIVSNYKKLVEQAEKINNELPAEYKDAFFELVLHPVKASANLNELYVAVARNWWLTSKKNIVANMWADSAKQFYINDSLLSVQYNKETAHGKWAHMMDQTHIGYTYWQQPPVNTMPEVKYVSKDSVTDLEIKVDVKKIAAETFIPNSLKGNYFYEQDDYVSIEASHYTRAITSNHTKWKVIPGIGRDGDGITTFPVTANGQIVSKGSPHLEYEVYVYDTGTIKLQAYFSPSLNFHNDDGLKYGISVDNGTPQIISINKEDNDKKTWEGWVANNVIIKTSRHTLSTPGKHTVKYWMVSPSVILQKLVIDFGGMKESYLGPPETKSK